MKVRLGILFLGVVLGLVCKWAFSDASKGQPKPDTDTPAKADSKPGDDETSHNNNVEVDPLVPPANIDGVMVSLDNGSMIGDGHESASHLPLLTSEFFTGERALFEPHGDKVCASGCAVSRHPTAKLTRSDFRHLIEQFADDPIDETSKPYEELLFYGRQTLDMMNRYGVGALDENRENSLREELVRTQAKISIRVVDDDGEIRTSLPPTSVPLDRRHVFTMDVNNVQPLVTSGTVKRVGLYHLWTRL